MSDFSPAWRRAARGLRRKINCAWWLQCCGTPLVMASLGLMGGILWARRYWPAEAETWRGWVVAAVVAAVLVWAWRAARRRFVSLAGAMTRLESRMGLHNRLSAAAAGACEWPEPPAKPDHGIRWAPGQTLLPVLAAAAFLAAAWWVPVTAAGRKPAPDEPAAWRTTEAELQKLGREDIIDPKSLDQTREKINELRAQEPEKWFSHGSLEATDKMRESHLQAAAELRGNLRQAAQGASRLTEGEGALTAKARANLQDQFNQAVEAMKAGAMKPTPAMLDQLREIDPNQLGRMDPEKLQEMIDELREAAAELGEWRPGGEDGEDGQGEGEGEDGDDGDGPGRGGVARGPGTSDDLFGKERHAADAQKPQVLESADLSRTMPGEVLDTTEVEREIDRASPALRAGGKADSSGGGNTTWQESLHPKEQEALKRFFNEQPEPKTP
ncbi:MAG: hypothetical protein K9N23_19320 [Akkermansiaceae bacterium]|nr:hypothetical protein [Akkermansiaceae bacterium]